MYMSEPILPYFNLSEKVLSALQLLPVFLNMSICTSTWLKDVCTFAISAYLKAILLSKPSDGPSPLPGGICGIKHLQ